MPPSKMALRLCSRCWGVIVAATPSRALAHELGRARGGDVFEHHAQLRKSRERRRQHFVDETRLAVEHIDMARGHLAMHQKRHAGFAHAREHVVDAPDVRDTGIRVGRGARRIKLAGLHPLRFQRLVDLGGSVRSVRYSVISGEKFAPAGRAARIRFAVFDRRGRGGHRRLQIRHHDGARETRRGERQHGRHGRAVAQVQVPVVGAADFDFH